MKHFFVTCLAFLVSTIMNVNACDAGWTAVTLVELPTPPSTCTVTVDYCVKSYTPPGGDPQIQIKIGYMSWIGCSTAETDIPGTINRLMSKLLDNAAATLSFTIPPCGDGLTLTFGVSPGDCRTAPFYVGTVTVGGLSVQKYVSYVCPKAGIIQCVT